MYSHKITPRTKVNLFNGNSVRRRSKRRNNVQDLFKIVKIYLWIHGLGLTRNSSTLATVLSKGLSILLEANSFYFCYIHYFYYGIEKNERVLILLAYISRAFLWCYLRYALFARRHALDAIARNLQSLALRIPRKHVKCFTRKSIAVFAGLDVCNIVLCIACNHLYNNDLPSIMTERNPLRARELIGLTESLVLFMQTEKLVAVYFAATCFTLKNILTGLEEMLKSDPDMMNTVVSLYNDALKVARKANCTFSFLLFTSCLVSLFTVFREAFNSTYTSVSKQKYMHSSVSVYYFFSFLIICWSGSSVLQASSNMKYLLQEYPPSGNSEKSPISVHFQGFTMLDSIPIDKSLIMSAVGALLTYGVMIATLSATSEILE